MLFDVQVATEPDGTIISVVGDVDLASLPRLASALERTETPVRTIDLRSVDWFDPLCTGVLVAAALRTRRQGGSLLVVATGAVAEMLAETRLDSVLSVES
jgi:anti-anti-sigma factor